MDSIKNIIIKMTKSTNPVSPHEKNENRTKYDEIPIPFSTAFLTRLIAGPYPESN